MGLFYAKISLHMPFTMPNVNALISSCYLFVETEAGNFLTIKIKVQP